MISYTEQAFLLCLSKIIIDYREDSPPDTNPGLYLNNDKFYNKLGGLKENSNLDEDSFQNILYEFNSKLMEVLVHAPEINTNQLNNLFINSVSGTSAYILQKMTLYLMLGAEHNAQNNQGKSAHEILERRNIEIPLALLVTYSSALKLYSTKSDSAESVLGFM